MRFMTGIKLRQEICKSNGLCIRRRDLSRAKLVSSFWSRMKRDSKFFQIYIKTRQNGTKLIFPPRLCREVKMKILVFGVFFGVVALGSTGPLEKEGEYKVADKQYLKRYKEILELFSYINQPSYYKEIVNIAKNYDIEKNSKYYLKPEVVEYFLNIYNNGLLPRGEIFSVFYKEQLIQAKALFKLFYYAKDFETFYKTACWARQNVNEGLFLYSFSVALRQREDCRLFALPPIYEIYPYYFFNTEVIQKANYYKQRYYGEASGKIKDGDFEGYTINANYSGYYLNLNPEQSLSYYLEDIGLNSFYYYYSINYPFWLSSDGDYAIQKDLYAPRGEIFYYKIQQLLARYYLERLANNFGDILDFEWDLPFKTGYYPSLRYANGLEFPIRPNFALLKDYLINYGQKQCLKFSYKFAATNIKDYERRLRDLIDRGKIFNNGKEIDLYSEEGLNVLGNLIEFNADSLNKRYYGPILFYARHLLGFSYQPKNKYQIAPSALEQYETSLRDPGFYQLYKRIFYLFLKYQQNLPAYSKKDLYFPGVSIKKAEFSRLETFYDYFYSDISNALYYTEDEVKRESFRIRARQYRLNNKPFNYKLYVNSDKPYTASVRVYLGPKLDEYGRPIDIIDNRINFVQFDYYLYNLTVGENIIERSSSQLFGYCNDCRSYRRIYKEVLEASSGKGEFRIPSTYYCFPRRLALPKGSLSGRPYQFYFIVSPYKPGKAGRSQKESVYPVRLDDYPLGYPFDRNIIESSYYNVPNAYFYDAKIYYDDAINKYNALIE